MLDVGSLYVLGIYFEEETQQNLTRDFPGLRLIQNLATPLGGVSINNLNQVRGINMYVDFLPEKSTDVHNLITMRLSGFQV